MDPNLQAQIQALIQQTLQSGQYSVPQTPYHVHNGTDSPKLPLSSTEAGVSSVTASGSGITASPTTGNVVVENTGVTSIVAGTNITVSGATGAVTVSASGGSSDAFQNGIFTRALNGSAGTTSIAHNLPAAPVNVHVDCVAASGGPYMFYSSGNWTSYSFFNPQTCIYSFIQVSIGGISGSTSSYAIWMRQNDGSQSGQTAVITVDATNIYFTWTSWGTPFSDNFYVTWSANT